jgi:hypothetical protein
VKKFYFVVNYFILIIINNDLCDIKSVKKLECFLFDIFERSEKKNKGGMTINCQTSPIHRNNYLHPNRPLHWSHLQKYLYMIFLRVAP